MIKCKITLFIHISITIPGQYINIINCITKNSRHSNMFTKIHVTFKDTEE